MKPLSVYLRKSFEKAAIEQIADDYREKGYAVKTDVKVGEFRVDIAASKNGLTSYIEVKTGKENPDAKRRIKAMADYFKTIPDAKFLLIVSRYPEPKKIVFNDIEQVLYDFFIESHTDLDSLSTHTRVNDISDVSIDEIRIQREFFSIVCNGMVGATMQYGADSEQEPGDDPVCMSFPFRFKGTVRFDGRTYIVDECEELTIDMDAYYE